MGKAKGKTQTIYRVACRHKPYAQLGNAMIRDNRLSFEARGVLAYILSYPENWRFSREWLCKHAKLGKNKSYDLINEMREHGYCQRSQERRPDGTMAPCEYLFTDEPEAIAPTPAPANEPDAPQADDGKAAPQDIVGVDNQGAADTQGDAPPLPENREPVNRFPENREPAHREPVFREAAYKKEDLNTVLNKEPPIAPRPSARGRPPTSYLPFDWTLPESDRKWALKHAPKIAARLDEEFDAFRDWHAGKRRADWSAAWRTWWRRAVKHGADRRGGPAAPGDGLRALAGGLIVGHADRGLGVRDAGESFGAYRERMIREGKYQPEMCP